MFNGYSSRIWDICIGMEQSTLDPEEKKVSAQWVSGQGSVVSGPQDDDLTKNYFQELTVSFAAAVLTVSLAICALTVTRCDLSNCFGESHPLQFCSVSV